MNVMSCVCSCFHCVFSTKSRQRYLIPALRERLWPFLGGIARPNKMKAIAVGGAEDHVHLLLSLPATMPVSKAVQLQEEFVTLLKKHGIGFDERYLWD